MTDLRSPPSMVDPAPATGAGGGPRRGPARRDLVLSRLVAGAAAMGGALASGAPSGNRAADVVFRAALAGIVTLAASRARRWSGLLLAGVAAVLAGDVTGRIVANTALAVSVGATFRRRRSRPWGAVAGGLAVQVLLRLPTDGWAIGHQGLPSLAVTVAVVPALVSAHRVASRRQRARERRAVAAVGALGLLATLLFVAVAMASRARAERGLDDIRLGLVALAKADPQAGSRLAAAVRALSAANARIDGWWSAPARVVPLVGHHVDALSTLTRQGSTLAGVAASSARAADLGDLRASAGRIDPAKVAAMEVPLRELEASLVAVQRQVESADSSWLLPPLADRQSRTEAQVGRALTAVRTAGEAVRVVPRLLGAGRPQRYFIAFVTPAESRGIGGYMGSYGELTAEEGRLTLSRSGRTLDLMAERRQPPDLAGAPPDYVARYGRFRPEEHLGDLTYSPDFPTVAGLLEHQYTRSTGVTVDGAIVIDPYALAALLRLTGPLSVPGVAEELAADNAAEFLLLGQYVRYPESQKERVELLGRITATLFERLSTVELPPLARIIQVLGPSVQQGRLAVHSTDTQAQALLRRAGLDGSLPAAGKGDFLSVVTQNSANNKIDVFLERTIDYRASVDPATGRLRATVEVTLHNKAPAAGLPDYVIGGTDPSLPRGTNRLFVSVYTPHQLLRAALDDRELPMESQRELGRLVHATFVTLAPGATATLRLDLEGRVPRGRYRLDYAPQPLVNPDRVAIRVDPAEGWRLEREGGFEAAAGRSVVARPRPDRDWTLRAVPRRR